MVQCIKVQSPVLWGEGGVGSHIESMHDVDFRMDISPTKWYTS